MKRKVTFAGFLLLGVIVLVIYHHYDPCRDLGACEQYRCLNPEFYCSNVLYESTSRRKVDNLESARQVVEEYLELKKRNNAAVTGLARLKAGYHWYQLTVQFEDGAEYGYEVGPDARIYEIKRLN